MRIVILGLYNSGSSVLAGILHNLGVYMGGPPFFRQCYEAVDVSVKLRTWWTEPDLVESVKPWLRVRYFRRWVKRKEQKGFTTIGIKHPLLCLSASDIEKAWGSEVRYIWSKRELDESIAGLIHRGWYFPDPVAMQNRLWESLMSFIAVHDHIEVPYRDLVETPDMIISKLVFDLGIPASRKQIERAAATVRRPST